MQHGRVYVGDVVAILDGRWDEGREAALVAELKGIVDVAIDRADAMEDPRAEDVYTGVFAPEEVAEHTGVEEVAE